ncbi:DEP domain-containing mTOR-interacting protein-like [Diadema antillarum]|uniref:DEP domain-containing mTOR-interacting protein-like n=1 Tax=Diadema antillarum TaxID=105358 RepID=UPI003A8A34F2
MRGKASSFDSSSVVSLGSRAAGNILIIGEKLRHALYAANPCMIRSRRYRLRSYAQCFVGSELVDWLIKQGTIKDRTTARQAMNVLHKYNVIHHVCDDHVFKDEILYYRFRVEDNTFVATRESSAYLQGTQVFQRVTTEPASHSLLKVHAEEGQQYAKSFYGAELVSWLLKSGFCPSREKALGLGKDLLEADIIRHVTMDHHFKDERMLYQFNPIMGDLGVGDLLTLDQEAGCSSSGEASMLSLAVPKDVTRKHSSSSSSDSSADKSSLSGSKPDISTPDQNQNRVVEERLRRVSSDLESPDTPTSRAFLPGCGQGSFSADELRQPDSPFLKQDIKINGDSVGFGLVIRGSGPTYVQTVDPKGPAAAAGLRVRQYISSVNGVDVLDKNHTDVAKLILANPFELSLVVLKLRDDMPLMV